MTTYTVGQTLWLASSRSYSTGREVTVTKIGRKWVTVKDWGREMRFDPATSMVDGQGRSGPGRVYPSREAWEVEVFIHRTWQAFRERVNHRYSAPSGLTVDALRQAAALLGIEMGDADG